jgi:predicted Zn finger-like uncharacterized protein
MLLVCPSCATSYDVNPTVLGVTGRNVRCNRCANVWFATQPKPEPVLAIAGEAEPPFAAHRHDTGLGGTEPADWTAPTEQMDNDGPADAGFAEDDAIAAPLAGTAEPPAVPTSEMAPEIDSPPLAPAADATPDPGESVEKVAARRLRPGARRSRKRSSTWIQIALLVLISFNAALLLWRHEVVRIFPQTASLFAAIGLPVNLRGLQFEDVKITEDESEGVKILIVEGAIANAASKFVEVPRLRFSVRNQAGVEIYHWTAMPSRPILGPQERLPFRSRLASPPPEMHDVMVRFLSRRDLTSGQ